MSPQEMDISQKQERPLSPQIPILYSEVPLCKAIGPMLNPNDKSG